MFPEQSIVQIDNIIIEEKTSSSSVMWRCSKPSMGEVVTWEVLGQSSSINHSHPAWLNNLITMYKFIIPIKMTSFQKNQKSHKLST